MKNAKTYESKVKKLLAGIKKAAASATPAATEPAMHVRVLIHSVLLADTTPKRTEKALAALEAEFVDFNELRVTQTKEIIECIGKDFLGIHNKAETISTVLAGLFSRVSDVKMDHIGELSKRDIRRHLREIGCPPFAEAMVSMKCYGIHAIPVDDSLRDILEINGQIHPGAELLDTQSFLERIISQKNGLAAHEIFREYIVKNSVVLQQKRKADAERKAAEEQAARKAAEKAEKAAEEQAARKADKEAKKAAMETAKKKADKEAKKATRKTAKKKADGKVKKATRERAAKKKTKKKVARKGKK